MKTIKRLSTLFLATFVLASCSLDDDTAPTNPPVDPPTLNIVETAQGAADLSVLVEAVIKADLVDTLSGAGPFTVLAPTNAAFGQFLMDNGFASLDEVPDEVLRQILLNHVISGEVPSSALIGSAGYASTNADGPENTKLSLYFDGTANNVVFNGGSNVTIVDIGATNGIVHIVNAVIGLPTLATFATTNPALTSLVAALGSADSQMPSPMLTATLANPTAGPLTVFTPTNDAFTSLLMELGVADLSEIDPATVEAVLGIHIIAGANVTSDELMTGSVTTLGGSDITIEIDSGSPTITDPNNRVTNIVTELTNIQAINGVAHVVDQVIRP